MHKKTRKGEIIPKTREKSLTGSQKRDFWWGRVNMWRPRDLYSLWGPRPEGLLTLSGRALPRKHADKSRASGRLRVARSDVQEYRPAV
jgi:hypothetical protein